MNEPHRTENDRSIMKTRWPELKQVSTDADRKEPLPEMAKPAPAGAPTVSLPEPMEVPIDTRPLNELMAARQSRRQFSGEPLTLQDLSFLLWSTQGVRKTTRKASFRIVPSGGARHPFETYLFVSRAEGLDQGLYRYLPFDHALTRLAEMEGFDERLNEALLDHLFGGAVTFVWTAVPYRSEWKYAFEASRLCLLDAGHVCQNLYLACEALGCGTCAVGAYDQRKMDELLGVDGEEEFTVYAAPVGRQA
jgi:SagB-type dehydrogenase family enzyme